MSFPHILTLVWAKKKFAGYRKLSELPKLLWDVWASADEIATEMEMKPTYEGVTLLKNLDSDFAASILSRITVDKAVSILNNPNLTASKAHYILASANITADRVQSILYRMLDLGYVDRLIDIITATAPDATISADTTVNGVIRYRDLTIDSLVTLTVDGQPGVLIANSITNNGTISKTPTGGDGGSATGVGKGGNGGGGLIIVAKSYSGGTVSADGANGENGGTTSSFTNGGDGGAGYMVVVGSDSPGNGGSASGSYAGAGGTPGGGGGGGGPENNIYGGGHGGNGGTIILGSEPSYNDIFLNTLKATIDYYITNVLGKSPTTTVDFYNVYGAGGGGGGDVDNAHDDGGGGGSGGQIIACILELNGGVWTARGGNGGNGGSEGNYDCGGGGGGGGVVYILYKNLIASPTIDVSGGAGGTGDEVGYDGTAGTGVAIQV